jgi:C1A family cysteine protease
LIPEHTPISDQGPLSSCVANATADAFEILRGLSDPSAVEQLSRLFVYWNARLYSRQTNIDKGTFIMYGMQSLIDYGICGENTWQYDPNKVFAQPNQLAYKEADDNTFKVDSFYKIRTLGSYRCQDIETAIRANHPVVFGTNVDASFENYNGGNAAIDPPSSWIGGHALVIVGVRYNPNLEFCIRNSWTSSWGNGGHAWLSAAYIMADFTDDLYVGTQMSGLLK